MEGLMMYSIFNELVMVNFSWKSRHSSINNYIGFVGYRGFGEVDWSASQSGFRVYFVFKGVF